MKLRNKDSGEIGKLLKLRDNDDDLEVMTDNKCYRYKTLAEQNIFVSSLLDSAYQLGYIEGLSYVPEVNNE